MKTVKQLAQFKCVAIRAVNIAILQLLQYILQYFLVLQQVLQYWFHI